MVLQNLMNLPEKISCLKLDTVFFESYEISYKILAPRVQKGGVIIVDNYYNYKGIKKATDEFINSFSVTKKIEKYKYLSKIVIYM